VHRARARVQHGPARFAASRDQQRRLVERLLRAIEAGDRSALLALLAPDATLASDGGGKVSAARNVIRGADRVARFLLGVARKLPDLVSEICPINGAPGVLRRQGGRTHSTLSIAAGDAGIEAVYIVLNPDKLQRIGAACSQLNA
jgi:RNA polymerase sigma-70 factor (ECF subfamily)